MKKKGLSKEIKIGIVTIASIGLLYFGINYLKGVNLFKPVNHYYVTFDNVKDVVISSPVYVEGFKVGLVRDIVYDYSTTGKITVEISLDNDMKINKGSYIVIVNNFLSGAELHIHLNKYVSDYMKSGERIEGRMGEDMMATVQNNILPGVEAILPKIDSILTGLQTLVNHPALSQSFNHIEKTTAHLEFSSYQLSQLLKHDVPAIASDLKLITKNFYEVSEELKGLDLEETIHSVNATLANLKLTTDKLHSKENSIGLLLNDKSLYNNLNSTMDNASKLLLDFKEHPKRYVHFSLF
jgi:phospholipid/cholesterol/gamma-HCH transport system substrate-binding protein